MVKDAKKNMVVVDIDNFISEHGVEIVIKGKTYLVQDIPTEVQEELGKVPMDHRKVVAMLLDLEDESILEGYGIVALAKIVNAVHENLLQRVSPKAA